MLRYIFYSISLPYYYQKECPFSFLSLSLPLALSHSLTLPLSRPLSLSYTPPPSLSLSPPFLLLKMEVGKR